jgi:hypothetical protein
MPTWLTALLTILLSTGGIAFFSMLGRGVLALRSGAAAREKETIANAKQMRAEQAAELRKESQDRRYWQDIAARYHWQLVSAGYEPDPREPLPPSQRARRRHTD